jgi:hypothetical protein
VGGVSPLRAGELLERRDIRNGDDRPLPRRRPCNSDNVMPNRGMAKNPSLPPPVPTAPTAKRPRGRPPSPGGPKSQAEIQRAYRGRLAAQAADAAVTRPDPETFVEMRDKLHNALLELELRDQDVARLEQRNADLESELKLPGAAPCQRPEGNRHAQAGIGAVGIGSLRCFVCRKLAVLHKQRAALGTARRQAGALLEDAPVLGHKEPARGRNRSRHRERRALGITGSWPAANASVRAALARRPDAKQAHLGECACLAPGDRLPVGDTTAGGPNTIGRGAGLPEIN